MYSLRAPTPSLRSAHAALRALSKARRTFASPPSVRPAAALPTCSPSLAPLLRRHQATQADAPSASSAPESAADFRKRFDINVHGRDVPDPIQTFEDAKWETPVYQELKRAGFPAPTPIQSQAWSIARQGRDMVAVSSTGSGKTVGFLLPAMEKIRSQSSQTRGSGPVALVLSPTRELATQIQDEARRFGRSSNLRTTLLAGGVPKGPQARELGYRPPELIVATPGRLIDMLESGYTTLKDVKYLVLDEADRMLDMGFGPQIQQILSAMGEHQTLMFSATWPREVQSIARTYMNDYVHVTVGSLELSANLNITQHVHFLDGLQKREKLIEHLEALSGEANKCLIFVTTKVAADILSDYLHKDGWPVYALHGDKSQGERTKILNDFRSGRTLVMIATDVASRGLDITDITCVINYDMPHSIEDYIHRIGRTARAGRKGISHAYMLPTDNKIARDLVKILGDAGQAVPDELARRGAPAPSFSRGGFGRGGGGGFRRGGYQRNDRSSGSQHRKQDRRPPPLSTFGRTGGSGQRSNFGGFGSTDSNRSESFAARRH